MTKRLITFLFLFLGLLPFTKLCWSYEAEIMKAIHLTYNAQFDEAQKILQSYIFRNPYDPVGYLVRGTSLKWQQKIQNLKGKFNDQILEDYQKAHDYSFRIWEKDPDNIEKMVNLGNSYMFLAKEWLDRGKKTRAGLILKKCKKHMEEAIKRDPTRYDAYLAIGIFNFYAAHIPPGLQFITSLLGISGDETVGLQQIGMAAAYPNIIQADALWVLVHAYAKTKKNYAKAQTYVQKLITLYPLNPYFRFVKGEYSFLAKNYAQAHGNFTDYLQFCNSHPGACTQNYLFLAHYFAAESQMNLKNFSGAEPHIEKALSLDEKQYLDRTAGLYLVKGRLLKAKGKKKEALEELQKIEPLQRHNASAWKEAQAEMISLQ